LKHLFRGVALVSIEERSRPLDLALWDPRRRDHQTAVLEIDRWVVERDKRLCSSGTPPGPEAHAGAAERSIAQDLSALNPVSSRRLAPDIKALEAHRYFEWVNSG